MRKLYVSDSRLHRASSSLWWSIPLGSLLQPAKICKLKVTSCHPYDPIVCKSNWVRPIWLPFRIQVKDVTVSSLSQEDKQVVAWNAKACKSNMPTTSSEEVRWVEMDRWIDMNCTLYILLNAFLRTILIDFGISVGVVRMYIGKICTDHHRS